MLPVAQRALTLQEGASKATLDEKSSHNGCQGQGSGLHDGQGSQGGPAFSGGGSKEVKGRTNGIL